MKTYFLLLCYFMLPILAGCGRKQTEAAGVNKHPLINLELSAHLPPCTQSNIGQIAYANQEKKVYFCNTKNIWEPLILSDENKANTSNAVSTDTSEEREADSCLSEMFYLAKHCKLLEATVINSVDLVSTQILNQVCPVFLNQIHSVIGQNRLFQDITYTDDKNVLKKYLSYLIPTYHSIDKKEKCVGNFIKNKAYHIQTFSSCSMGIVSIKNLHSICN